MAKEILYDSYYKAIPVTLDTEQFDNITDGVIPAGTLLVGANVSAFDDRTQKVKKATASGNIDGVLMADVDVNGNAHGSLVYKGTLWANKLDTALNANIRNKLSGITFVAE